MSRFLKTLGLTLVAAVALTVILPTAAQAQIVIVHSAPVMVPGPIVTNYAPPTFYAPSISYSAPSYVVPAVSYSAPSYVVPSISYSAPVVYASPRVSYYSPVVTSYSASMLPAAASSRNALAMGACIPPTRTAMAWASSGRATSTRPTTRHCPRKTRNPSFPSLSGRVAP